MEEKDQITNSGNSLQTNTGDKWIDLADNLMPANLDKHKSQLHQTLNRVRRLAPLLAIASAASAGTAGGAAGYAISQALGQSGSAGGMTREEIAIMKWHASDLGDLRIDSKQHTAVINNLTYRLQFFETQIIGNFEGTLAMLVIRLRIYDG